MLEDQPNHKDDELKLGRRYLEQAILTGRCQVRFLNGNMVIFGGIVTEDQLVMGMNMDQPVRFSVVTIVVQTAGNLVLRLLFVGLFKTQPGLIFP